jgi:hypothetical protein
MKYLKSFLAALVLVSNCNGANASTVTYRFTMTVERMFEYDGATSLITTVTNSTMPGVRFANGDQVEGSFTYSTDMPLTAYQSDVPSTGSYLIYGGGVTSNLRFTSTGWTYESNPDPWISTILVANDASTFSGSDIFGLTTAAVYSPIQFEMMTLNLFDRTGGVFDTGSIPVALPLSSFNYSDLDYAWLRQSDGSQMHASGHLTSLSVETGSSNIPVPPTIALLIVGLSALFLSRRRITALRF